MIKSAIVGLAVLSAACTYESSREPPTLFGCEMAANDGLPMRMVVKDRPDGLTIYSEGDAMTALTRIDELTDETSHTAAMVQDDATISAVFKPRERHLTVFLIEPDSSYVFVEGDCSPLP